MKEPIADNGPQHWAISIINGPLKMELQGSIMASLPSASLTPLTSMAASPILRVFPLLRHRLQLHHHRIAASSALFSAPLRWSLSTAAGDSFSPEGTYEAAAADSVSPEGTSEAAAADSSKRQRLDDPDYRQWKDKEEEILRDIEPILLLTKDILHSRTYMDGERLKAEDEKVVVEKLLVYHPHAEDKVGCGLDSIMVDRHPQFRQSRCLFLIRTDGAWVDFSYQKCLRQYIREKYPTHAERFIREHFKRSSR